MPDASGINEIKAVKKTGPSYKCGGPYLQCECKSNGNNKFQNKSATQQMQLHINFETTKHATICSQWEHCPSRHHNQ